jgi:hypothetical protein
MLVMYHRKKYQQLRRVVKSLFVYGTEQRKMSDCWTCQKCWVKVQATLDLGCLLSQNKEI